MSVSYTHLDVYKRQELWKQRKLEAITGIIKAVERRLKISSSENKVWIKALNITNLRVEN